MAILACAEGLHTWNNELHLKNKQSEARWTIEQGTPRELVFIHNASPAQGECNASFDYTVGCVAPLVWLTTSNMFMSRRGIV
jgi:hypothetical protein